MSIAPEEVLPFINRALDGMLQIVETLGDARVNQRPPLPNANSPYIILVHCVGLTHNLLGAVLVGVRSNATATRNFVPTAPWQRFGRRCGSCNSTSRRTSPMCGAISRPLFRGDRARATCKIGSKAPFCCNATQSWPNTTGIWNSPAISSWRSEWLVLTLLYVRP